MKHFEGRAGHKLRRTYHGALQATSCPGPDLTRWARAGFPAPKPKPTTKEDTMPITETDADLIGTQLLNRPLGRSGPTVQVALQRAGRGVPQIQAELVAVRAQLKQLAAKTGTTLPPVTPDTIQAGLLGAWAATGDLEELEAATPPVEELDE